MTLTQNVTVIVVLWAIIGGLGASLLLPAMQSLIHGNFEGAAQKNTYALVGASAAVGAAIGPLRGLRHHLPVVACRLRPRGVIIAIVLSQIKPLVDVPFAGLRKIDTSAPSSPSSAWAGSCAASWSGRKAASSSCCSSPSVRSHSVRLALVGMVLIIPVIPRGESGWALLVPLLIARSGLGLPVPQLNNYILAPIEEVRVSEAAGVNSAGQSFGLSFGLAVAGGLLLAALSLSFIDMTQSSDVIPPPEQELIADALEDNAQLVSTQLEELLADQPDEIRDEIVRINSDAGNLALQVAMLVPILACLFGFINAFRVMRLPDYKPSAAIEGLVGG